MNLTDWYPIPIPTGNDALPIVIDDREQRSGVPAALEETGAFQLAFERLPVLRTRTPAETAAVMLYAALQGRATARRGLPRQGYRQKGKAAVQSYVLQGIPTVGPARARKLIRHFGSVGAVLTADEETLRAVDGIGARTAGFIAWAGA